MGCSIEAAIFDSSEKRRDEDLLAAPSGAISFSARTLQPRLDRQIEDPHPAAPQALLDPVAGEFIALGQLGQRWGSACADPSPDPGVIQSQPLRPRYDT